jgi:hypothetical protein
MGSWVMAQFVEQKSVWAKGLRALVVYWLIGPAKKLTNRPHLARQINPIINCTVAKP